ncbi:sialate O-acetylesterase [Oleiharenicola lentus]|uniref:Sialate O-acetylesterase n=1 Tax=Oleiharenicola lentus TaxID=2508720 RepID=A0A4V1M642_9BACT|nr:sialate O-acetylesterase [Oleiharenicola lentus]RXK53706.1 sialate O-acetylesterase [Oleiharenicola lentus]
MHPAPLRALLACLLLVNLAPAQTPPALSPANGLASMKIFLLIGQSNMAGRGKVESGDQTPHPRVWVLNKELAWVPAVDPLHFDRPERIGTGLGKTFGAVIADANPDAVIGLVPAAFGGSALDEWAPGRTHYVNAVARAKEALKRGQLAGILWHQGESDRAPDQAATYADRFKKFITQLRADLGAPDVPVIVGEIGRFCPNEGPVNAALRSLPALVPHCALVSSDGLPGRPEEPEVLHFESPGFRELGRRYAQAWREMNIQR